MFSQCTYTVETSRRGSDLLLVYRALGPDGGAVRWRLSVTGWNLGVGSHFQLRGQLLTRQGASSEKGTRLVDRATSVFPPRCRLTRQHDTSDLVVAIIEDNNIRIFPTFAATRYICTLRLPAGHHPPAFASTAAIPTLLTISRPSGKRGKYD